MVIATQHSTCRALRGHTSDTGTTRPDQNRAVTLGRGSRRAGNTSTRRRGTYSWRLRRSVVRVLKGHTSSVDVTRLGVDNGHTGSRVLWRTAQECATARKRFFSSTAGSSLCGTHRERGEEGGGGEGAQEVKGQRGGRGAERGHRGREWAVRGSARGRDTGRDTIVRTQTETPYVGLYQKHEHLTMTETRLGRVVVELQVHQ